MSPRFSQAVWQTLQCANEYKCRWYLIPFKFREGGRHGKELLCDYVVSKPCRQRKRGESTVDESLKDLRSSIGKSAWHKSLISLLTWKLTDKSSRMDISSTVTIRSPLLTNITGHITAEVESCGIHSDNSRVTSWSSKWFFKVFRPLVLFWSFEKRGLGRKLRKVEIERWISSSLIWQAETLQWKWGWMLELEHYSDSLNLPKHLSFICAHAVSQIL